MVLIGHPVKTLPLNYFGCIKGCMSDRHTANDFPQAFDPGSHFYLISPNAAAI